MNKKRKEFEKDHGPIAPSKVARRSGNASGSGEGGSTRAKKKKN